MEYGFMKFASHGTEVVALRVPKPFESCSLTDLYYSWIYSEKYATVLYCYSQ